MTSIIDIWGLQPALDNKAPTDHHHRISEVEGLRAALDAVEQGDNQPTFIGDIEGLQAELDDKASVDALTGLQSAIDSKASTSGVASALSTLQSALDGKAAAAHNQAIGTVTGLQTALDGKASNDTVTGLQTALDGKAATAHSHAVATTSTDGFLSAADKVKLNGLSTSTGPVTVAVSDVTGLQTALDGKAASGHTQVIDTIIGLQSALDGKASATHTQAIATVTGLQTALDGKAATAHAHAVATSGADGFMSAADKAKLDTLGAATSSANLVYTASQSSNYTNNNSYAGTYEKFTDNSRITGGSTNTGNLQYIQADLGSIKTVTGVTLGCGNVGWGATSPSLEGCKLEASEDSTNWSILIWAIPNIGETIDAPFLFGLFKARYIRVSRLASSYIALSTFRVFGY